MILLFALLAVAALLVVLMFGVTASGSHADAEFERALRDRLRP